MKKILIAVIVLGVLAVVGVMFLLGNLGSIIKSATERYGSEATQSKVTLSSADVSLGSGEGTLKGLVVGNPKGFETPNAFELGEITVKLDTSSLTSDKIVVRELVIEAPKVTYELGATFASNLAKLQSNVDEYMRSLGVGGGETKATPEGGGKKFVIQTLRIRGGRVELSAAVAKRGPQGVTIPDIEVHDIGRGDGATPQQIVAKVLDVLVDASIDAAAKGGLEKAAQGLLDGAVDKATDALKGILGGEKKDDTGKKKQR